MPAVLLAVLLAVVVLLTAQLCLARPTWAAPIPDDVVLPSPANWPLADGPQVLRTFDPPATAWGAGHRGVDLLGRVGDPVLAAAAGTVTFVGTVAGTDVVTISHGSVRTTYEPVSAEVRVGQQVSLGSVIGALRAGHCDNLASGQACLHWGLLRGEDYLDPLRLIPGDVGGPSAYRLVPATERAAVRRRMAAAAALAAAMSLAAPGLTAPGLTAPLGPPGRHGFAHPLAGPITSPFGMRLHPILHVWKLHDGTDFGAACGTPIRAPYAGRVTQQYFNAGYGNRLMLDHGVVDSQHVVSGFNHAVRYAVGVGARVQKGQVIGYVGETGYATGCHLHLMVWLNGRLVNPMTWYS